MDVIFAPPGMLPGHISAAKEAIARHGSSYSEVHFVMHAPATIASLALGKIDTTRIGSARRTRMRCPDGHLVHVWSVEHAPAPSAVDCPLCPDGATEAVKRLLGS